MRMRELHQLCEHGGGRPKVVDMGQWFMDTTFNVIVRMVVGKRYFDGSGGEGEQMRQFQKALTELGYIKAMKRTSKELEVVLVTWIEEHQQKKRDESGNAEGEQDFIDVMLSSLEGVELSGLGPDTAIKATALVAGGMDTSAVTITWALALLLNHPPVLDKNEVRLLSLSRLRSRKTRIHNSVPLKRRRQETCRVQEGALAPVAFRKKESDTLSVALSGMPSLHLFFSKLHRDPHVWWPDPEEFHPERFLADGEAAGVDVRGRHFGCLPFSSGRLMCPAVNLALLLMQLILARLIHGFDLGVHRWTWKKGWGWPSPRRLHWRS
ncbi:hypothetical protein Taro_008431 [Colocasia esculenta]|uniref:Cytochrome P450 n=1 Tax=Colocasia esculenta TaxID=4460 RepID=A0A843U2Y2_COLES|nr:hypothetical protein [Colocasia esculenta]